jgi:hypothetical protein
LRKNLYPYHQLCFKCGDRNHLLQSCPSSTWSDPRDWNILSCRGRRVGFSKDFLKSRDSLQQLMNHLAHDCPWGPRASRWSVDDRSSVMSDWQRVLDWLLA